MESNTDYKKYIGQKIRQARKKSKYTQEKLAEEASLTPKYISNLERGISFGSVDTIINICKALNISSDFLFDELIKSSGMPISSLVDDKFIETYLQLDERNRTNINLLALQLIKLQENEKKKRII